MSSTYYSPGHDRAERVRALFGQIAKRYDLINDIQSLGLHRIWKRQLVRRARITPGTRVLDVCCGTGDLALAMARIGAKVIGIDFCAPMLAVASARSTADAARRDGNRLQLAQADAQELPFVDGAFDVVTISYGLRNLADLDRGLAEFLRVLRRGGRLLILDFGRPDSALWRRAYEAYLGCVVPLFGWLFAADSAAYAYILDSLKRYPAQRGVDDKLRGLGCQRVEIVDFMGGAMSLNLAENSRSPGSGSDGDESGK